MILNKLPDILLSGELCLCKARYKMDGTLLPCRKLACPKQSHCANCIETIDPILPNGKSRDRVVKFSRIFLILHDNDLHLLGNNRQNIYSSAKQKTFNKRPSSIVNSESSALMTKTKVT